MCYEDNDSFIKKIQQSLIKQEDVFNNSLILNPVENVPFQDILEPCSGFLHGLYNTDTERTTTEKYASKIQFSGRNAITSDINQIYSMWADLLGGEKMSMRLLSGLHAHTVLFMAITNIGDKVLYLSEKAGGHTSGKAILERLGLTICELPYDAQKKCIDMEKAKEIYDDFQPDVLFIDRSEGLIYEDFTELCQYCTCYKVFDASQYLTNIICNDYKNPFDMGFDLILSTMHKNLPGPQRAFVCTKVADEKWNRLRSHISKYVSNMHVFSIYSAGLLLGHMDELKILSKNMLSNAISLDDNLVKQNIPVIPRFSVNNDPPTHHCWIKPSSREKAFKLYLDLEKIGILTNYRLLPYNIGYGLRLGMSGATMTGLRPHHTRQLAQIIKNVYANGYSEKIHHESKMFIKSIKGMKDD